MPTSLLDLARYEVWADAQLLRSVDAIQTPADSNPTRLLAHLAAAKEIWLDRLDGRLATAPLWPDWPLEDCLGRLTAADQCLLDRAPAVAAEPDRIVEYRTSTGTPQSTPAHILLTHLVNHGTYHRGQLAVAVKAAGGQPAVTDFIAWHRAGMP